MYRNMLSVYAGRDKRPDIKVRVPVPTNKRHKREGTDHYDAFLQRMCIEPGSVYEGVGGCACHKHACGHRQLRVVFEEDAMVISGRRFDWQSGKEVGSFRRTRWVVTSAKWHTAWGPERYSMTLRAEFTDDTKEGEGIEWSIPAPWQSAFASRIARPLYFVAAKSDMYTKPHSIDPLSRHPTFTSHIDVDTFGPGGMSFCFTVDPFFQPQHSPIYYIAPVGKNHVPRPIEHERTNTRLQHLLVPGNKAPHPTNWRELMCDLGALEADAKNPANQCFQLSSLCMPFMRGDTTLLVNTDDGRIAGIGKPRHKMPVLPVHLRGYMELSAPDGATVVQFGEPILMNVCVRYVENVVDNLTLKGDVLRRGLEDHDRLSDYEKVWNFEFPYIIQTQALFERVSNNQFRVTFNRSPLHRESTPTEILETEHTSFAATRLSKKTLEIREYRVRVLAGVTDELSNMSICKGIPLQQTPTLRNPKGGRKIRIRMVPRERLMIDETSDWAMEENYEYHLSYGIPLSFIDEPCRPLPPAMTKQEFDTEMADIVKAIRGEI